jgi:hypothetical protein
VSSDCRYYFESEDLSFEYYCCLEGHSVEDIQKSLQKEFRKIPKSLKYRNLEKID